MYVCKQHFYSYSRLVICVCKLYKLIFIILNAFEYSNSLYKYIFHADRPPSIAKHVENTEIDSFCYSGHTFKQREKNDFDYGL